MTSTAPYLEPLPPSTSLQIFNSNKLIFSSPGKWLHPLFEFGDFLKTYKGDVSDLSSHDSAIGKAAAVLSIRFGIKKIHANLISDIALNYINEKKKGGTNIEVHYDKKIDKLKCMTEKEYEPITDEEEIYQRLCVRREAALERMRKGLPSKPPA